MRYLVKRIVRVGDYWEIHLQNRFVSHRLTYIKIPFLPDFIRPGDIIDIRRFARSNSELARKLMPRVVP